MRRKIFLDGQKEGRTEGQTEGWTEGPTEVKQYTPLRWSGGYNYTMSSTIKRRLSTILDLITSSVLKLCPLICRRGAIKILTIISTLDVPTQAFSRAVFCPFCKMSLYKERGPQQKYLP